MEVKETDLKLGFMGASTPGVVHSTEDVEEYMAEMAGWPIRNDIQVKKYHKEALEQ